MKIKNAWSIKQLPMDWVLELEDNSLVMLFSGTIKPILDNELIPYNGYHPSDIGGVVMPDVLMTHYGLTRD